MKRNPFILYLLSIASLLPACKNHIGVQAAEQTKTLADPITNQTETTIAALEVPQTVIKLNGKVVPNEARQAKVFALISGKVSQVTKELGDYVQKGQVLAIIHSTEVASMASDVSVAELNVAMAKKNVETLTDLYSGNLATEREKATAELEWNKALSELKRAKQIAAITGGKSASYTVKAPISGFIIEKNITNLSEVRQDNDNSLFTIADLANVWVMANVYESDINTIHLGDEVRVNTLSNPGKEYNGKIDKIYNMLDPDSRTMQVQISMNNTDYELRPGMFATVKVAEKATGLQVAIPYKAIVFNNGKLHVVVQKEDASLHIREIQMIQKVGDKAFVKGLEEGEAVVTNGQVFLFQSLIPKS